MGLTFEARIKDKVVLRMECTNKKAFHKEVKRNLYKIPANIEYLLVFQDGKFLYKYVFGKDDNIF